MQKLLRSHIQFIWIVCLVQIKKLSQNREKLTPLVHKMSELTQPPPPVCTDTSEIILKNHKYIAPKSANVFYGCTMLCVCHITSTQKLFCLHVFRQAGLTQRVDCLAQRWETAFSVFPKDIATRYRIGRRTKVSHPFHY